MTHTYHDDLPGFDERQIWHDGCAACKARGLHPLNYLAVLDDHNLRRAFKRSADWNRDKDIGAISDAERGLLEAIWRIEVVLERHCGIPIGTLPHRDGDLSCTKCGTVYTPDAGLPQLCGECLEGSGWYETPEGEKWLAADRLRREAARG